MATHQHSESLTESEHVRIASLLPGAIEAFRHEVRAAVHAYSAATHQRIETSDSFNGIAVYKLHYPAASVRFRFSADECVAMMFGLFRHARDQAARAEMHVCASAVIQGDRLFFRFEHDERALSPEDLAEHWLTWFFERI